MQLNGVWIEHSIDERLDFAVKPRLQLHDALALSFAYKGVAQRYENLAQPLVASDNEVDQHLAAALISRADELRSFATTTTMRCSDYDTAEFREAARA